MANGCEAAAFARSSAFVMYDEPVGEYDWDWFVVVVCEPLLPIGASYQAAQDALED